MESTKRPNTFTRVYLAYRSFTLEAFPKHVSNASPDQGSDSACRREHASKRDSVSDRTPQVPLPTADEAD
jgi:hypothetical protein